MKDHTRNTLGSEVEEGYRCKPVRKDPNRPILSYRHHILVCSGDRCESAGGGEALADSLRDLTGAMDLKRGETRIKVSRSACLGACRFRSVTLIYENHPAPANHCVWLKESHDLQEEEWREILLQLKESRSLQESLSRRIIPME